MLSNNLNLASINDDMSHLEMKHLYTRVGQIAVVNNNVEKSNSHLEVTSMDNQSDLRSFSVVVE